MLLCEWFLIFGRNEVSLTSRVKQSKKNEVFFLDCWTLENEDTVFLENMKNHSLNNTVSRPTSDESPVVLL